jgi:hypothetical protein
LSQSSSGRASPPVPIRPPPRSSREEMAQAFPALYRSRAYPYNPQRNYSSTSRPGPSHASSSGRSGPSHRPYKQKPMVKNLSCFSWTRRRISTKGTKEATSMWWGTSRWHDGIPLWLDRDGNHFWHWGCIFLCFG